MGPEHADLLATILWAECRRQGGAALAAHAERVAWADRLGVAYEETKRALERAGAARPAGTWYTPAALVEQMLNHAMPLAPEQGFHACDPACGTGNFLVAVGERLVGAGWRAGDVPQALAGMDLDPFAVAIARTRMRARFGGSAAQWQRAVRSGDSLAAEAWTAAGAGDQTVAGDFDLVVGNPPFLGQLSRSTARDPSARAAAAARFGGVVAGYADAASAFLLLACELAARNGTVALVQPLSVLAAADALPVRRRCEALAALTTVIFPSPRAFGASVHTCVPMLRRSCASGVSVAVLAHDRAALTLPAVALHDGAWSAALAAARGVPEVRTEDATAPLSTLARATADFRQHYYGLVGHVREASAGVPARGELRMITVGAIGAAACAWGERPTRLHGRVYQAPVLLTASISSDPMLARWLHSRRVPKILMATQTRAIEAYIDEQAECLPSTPVITVEALQRRDLWRVAAALLAPPTAAIAWRRHAGAALSPGALKLSATQVLALPIPAANPASARAWRAGATALARWQRSGGESDRDDFAASMCQAYGIPAGPARQELLRWWKQAIRAPSGAR